MTSLFESTSINGMDLKNRFARSATWEGLASNEGYVTFGLTEKMVELAKGEVGLIITGYAFVNRSGQSSPRQMAIYDDTFVPGLKEMTTAIHNVDGKIALQIVHGGEFSIPELTGIEIVGPSDIEKEGKLVSKALTETDIKSLISDFISAAKRSKQAGFDAVQLHAAHGFLISQFLSPTFNKRTDNYGGTLENRARLLLEIVKGIRQEVGSDYPILVKLNSEDFLEGGLTREEAIQISVMLQEATVGAIEYSGGTVISPDGLMPPRPGALKAKENEGYYRDAAISYKQRVKIPLMLVGGIRSFDVAEDFISNGVCDYISISRPLICEPNLIKRWHDGDHRKAECISCNSCFGPPSEGKGFYCVTMEKKRQKLGS